ncbi:MAG: hypothetical protein K2K97_04955 [Muribaculaceae bacterium]|nr:hypothetical protein [Muribaculaceae bacterium]
MTVKSVSYICIFGLQYGVLMISEVGGEEDGGTGSGDFFDGCRDENGVTGIDGA